MVSSIDTFDSIVDYIFIQIVYFLIDYITVLTR